MRGPIRLTALEDEDLRVFGAKATNLARMARAGLPVPDGFCVSFEARDPGIGDEEARAILAAYGDLGEGASVAVRSSAVGEDADEASFAGQYETFLDLGSGEEAIRSIGACVASLRSERAAVYREHAGARITDMGVVIQLMVDAGYAGVCFSRSPLGRDEIVVEVVRGPGEELVSGRRRPARIGFSRDGLRETGSDDPEGELAAFGRDNALEVARLSLRAEQVLGRPVDVEWAHADGTLWLLQARPITAVDLEAEREEIRKQEIARLSAGAGRRVEVWSDFSVADMVTNPAPLGMWLWQESFGGEGGVGRAFRRIGFRYARRDEARRIVETICARAFLNVTELVRSSSSDFPITVDVDAIEAGRTFDPAAPPVAVDWRDAGRILALPLSTLRWLLVVPFRFLRLRRSFHREYVERIHPVHVEEAARERARDLTVLSPEELWEVFVSRAGRISRDLICLHQLSDIFAFATHRLLARNLRILYGDGASDMEARLTTALEGNFNTESNLALAGVAAGAQDMDGFISEYGHRGNPDWDPAAPRWREDRSRVERMAAMISRSGVDPLARFEEQRAARIEAEERFADDLGRSWLLRPWRRAVLRELEIYQRYSPLRETTQSGCYLWVELLRKVVLEAGRRTGGGDLLFHLSPEDLRRHLLEGRRDLLDRARADRRRSLLARGIFVPHVVRSDELEAIGRAPAIDRGVREVAGCAASTGVVRGRARVVVGLEEARSIERGEILVAERTDPAWTPLFLVAGGLVLEQGGMLSHGAIVAREHGLPAVINVANATRIIETGQQILVDATRGRVSIEVSESRTTR